MKIKLKGLTKRGIERIKQHGEIMKCLKNGEHKGQNAIFVESLNGTSYGGRKWCGWFTNEEVQIVELNCD